MELGEYIAKYRKEAGVTLDDLAARSGVPKGTINKIIAGTTKSPTLETVCSIANALGKTINDFMDPPQGSKKTAPLYSSEAAKIAKDYDSLDHWGKAAVRSVADTELARMQDEARFLAETSMEPEPKVVNLFTDPSAAGPALGITGQSCEPYTLTPNDPQGAAYAVRVQGDSMEPDFPDGSIAGTIGGGISEASAKRDALRALAENAPMIGHYALNSTGGAVCGGKVEYLIIPVQ